ncbi:hypothetical protein VZT92_003827 [Zoarces viviparus]|uniref:Uncharacterized protein n=1 Tax=Zoarces viviparus TaxID=48416 RepID=A0AAW1FV53_ZOAVI
MERRQRAALETTEKCERDREEREKATHSRRRQRGEKEMWQEGLEKMKQNQLKRERLQWNEVVMMLEEHKGAGDTLSALEKEARGG